jgi:predicted homoserine dehydrogenase-like protein
VNFHSLLSITLSTYCLHFSNFYYMLYRPFKIIIFITAIILIRIFTEVEFRTVVRNATCGIETKFIVIKGKINSLPLLSKATLLELGMMQIRPDGSFEVNFHSLLSITLSTYCLHFSNFHSMLYRPFKIIIFITAIILIRIFTEVELYKFIE